MPKLTLTTRTIIGLEIHVQLNTRTKMFCGCPVRYDAPPNSCVCPVCLGHPGALPVINRQAFTYAVLTGLALNCKIAGHTKWDRKSYYPSSAVVFGRVAFPASQGRFWGDWARTLEPRTADPRASREHGNTWL